MILSSDNLRMKVERNTLKKSPLLPPIKAAEVVKCVRKYIWTESPKI